MIKVGVYIDGSNIYHGGLQVGWQIDYSKFLKFIERKYEIAIINYYNSIGYEKGRDGKYLKDQRGNYIHNQATLKFENVLKTLGIKVISKPLKFVHGNEAIATNKLDGDIMIDALLESKKWDELLLLSGDSDFERLVKEMVSQNKKVNIFSFTSRISHELIVLSKKSEFVNFTKIDNLRKILIYKHKIIIDKAKF